MEFAFKLNNKVAWVGVCPDTLLSDGTVRVFTKTKKFSTNVDFYNLPDYVQHWVKNEFEDQTGYLFDLCKNQLGYLQEKLIRERV